MEKGKIYPKLQFSPGMHFYPQVAKKMQNIMWTSLVLASWALSVLCTYRMHVVHMYNDYVHVHITCTTWIMDTSRIYYNHVHDCYCSASTVLVHVLSRRRSTFDLVRLLLTTSLNRSKVDRLLVLRLSYSKYMY